MSYTQFRFLLFPTKESVRHEDRAHVRYFMLASQMAATFLQRQNIFDRLRSPWNYPGNGFVVFNCDSNHN